mmetsp:Transcript_1859/g.4444  ORF Transcript_1859/g.4444 Transcript_1859/m.4444 type:complete len:282 (-) Transcript_1859:311-1156(-)
MTCPLRPEMPRSAPHCARNASEGAHVLLRRVGLSLCSLEVEVLGNKALFLRRIQGPPLAHVDTVRKIERYLQAVQTRSDIIVALDRAWEGQHVDGDVLGKPSLGGGPVCHRPGASATQDLRIADLWGLQGAEGQILGGSSIHCQLLHLGPSEVVVEVVMATKLLQPDPAPIPVEHTILQRHHVVVHKPAEALILLSLRKDPRRGNSVRWQRHQLIAEASQRPLWHLLLLRIGAWRPGQGKRCSQRGHGHGRILHCGARPRASALTVLEELCLDFLGSGEDV